MLGSERLMASSGSPGKAQPFLPPRSAELEDRKGGRREEDSQLWMDAAQWEGGPKPGAILETCSFVKLHE